MPITDKNRITLVQFGQNSIGAAMSARYLSGILRAQGFEVTIVCVELSKMQGSGLSWDYGYYDISDDAIKNLFEISRGSLFIGITVYSFVAYIVNKIYASKYNLKDIPFVVGGPHATLDPYNSSLFSDYVCIGDGERAIVELAQRLRRGDLPAQGDALVPVADNIYSSSVLRKSGEGRVLFGKEASLDSQSLPDYSFQSEYYLSEGGCEKITPENAGKHVNIYATFFSRGCVNDCSYCGHDTLAHRSGFQKRIKSKDIQHFIKELKMIRKSYPWVSRVAFFDPNILSNRRDALEAILREYRSSVELPLSVTGFTFNQINEEIFRNFLSAGMDSVIFGIESGSEKTRKLYNRRESKEQILKVDELNHRLKKDFTFNIQYDVIVDSPWESVDDAMESLAFIARLKGYDYLDIFSLRFLPGTRLFQKAIEEGILKREDVDRENRRVFHSMNRTYENFLFLLVRDGFLREGWAFRIAVKPRTVRFMRKLFGRYGERIFRLYASKKASGFIAFHKKVKKFFWLLKTAGVRKTLGILKDKLRRKLR
ncbi:MAG: B12-binding domain-containing radical SAM protein [Candidatus Omnitrophota bacterium]|jgi:radical SAM superfamily enzyme YgiQ (UPF0313 family)